MKTILKLSAVPFILLALLSYGFTQEVVTEEAQPELEKPLDVTPEGLTGEPAAEAPKEEAPAPTSTFSVTPVLMLRPIGTDKDLGNQAVWFAIEPGVSLNMSFPTGTGRTLGVSAGYNFYYRQYLDNNTEIKFEHEVAVGLSHNFSSKLSMSLPAKMNIYQYYRFANQANNEFDLEAWPSLGYRITDALTINIGVYTLLLYSPNGRVYWDEAGGTSNPPTDPGELVRGLSQYTNDMYAYDDYSLYSSLGITPPVVSGDPTRLSFLGPYTQIGYKFTPTTTGTLRYRYYAYTWSNSDGMHFRGHELWFIVAQDVWKGGNMSLTYRPRYRKLPYVFSEIGNHKVDWRQRVIVTFNQAINSFIGIDAAYMFEHIESNCFDPKNAHEFGLGVSFTF